MKIYQVSPHHVKVLKLWSKRHVDYQKDRLEKEGQIEPIHVVIVHDEHYYVSPEEWAYSEAQVLAARELEWPTILVTY